MKYSGRIVIMSVIIVVIACTRIYGSMYYNYPPLNFPTIALFTIVACWMMGTQYDKLKFLSEKDVLTTLYNRRFILATFPKLVSRANRTNKKLIVYYIDVDDFKIINDTRGHEFGDRVLNQIAHILTVHSQKKDLVVRWAGDEFLIISTISEGYSKERVISRIQNELLLVSQEFDIAISVSIGTAIYPDVARNLDDLLHVADQDMYALKSQKKQLYVNY